ncbi:hypothetical protein FB451DRAFT_1178560 [Mycena latifolia]|nr:hypothetical protein FB451DRAFT_1178560 [Mycena latifolia]
MPFFPPCCTWVCVCPGGSSFRTPFKLCLEQRILCGGWPAPASVGSQISGCEDGSDGRCAVGEFSCSAHLVQILNQLRRADVNAAIFARRGRGAVDFAGSESYGLEGSRLAEILDAAADGAREKPSSAIRLPNFGKDRDLTRMDSHLTPSPGLLRIRAALARDGPPHAGDAPAPTSSTFSSGAARRTPKTWLIAPPHRHGAPASADGHMDIARTSGVARLPSPPLARRPPEALSAGCR